MPVAPMTGTGPAAATPTVFTGTLRTNLILSIVAALALLVMQPITGAIPSNNGQGWDGSDYAQMTMKTVRSGTPNTALRPLVVLLNRPAFTFFRYDVVETYRVMN